MTNELFELKSGLYRAAADYHRTAGEYFAALTPHAGSNGRMPQIRRDCLGHRREYALALELLINYLLANEPTSHDLDAAQRTRQLLAHELRLESADTPISRG
jgi:hypothetical protein